MESAAMTPSQRATLTKQLLKTHNSTTSTYSGLTIRIPLADNYSIIYHSGGPNRTHKGFKLKVGDEYVGYITYAYRKELYSVNPAMCIDGYSKAYNRFSTQVTREAFHDMMMKHPPLMEWILFNGF